LKFPPPLKIEDDPDGGEHGGFLDLLDFEDGGDSLWVGSK